MAINETQILKNAPVFEAEERNLLRSCRPRGSMFESTERVDKNRDKEL